MEVSFNKKKFDAIISPYSFPGIALGNYNKLIGITSKLLIREISEHLDISLKLIHSEVRLQEVCYARVIIVYFFSKRVKLNDCAIARMLSWERDRVLYARNKILPKLKKDRKFLYDISQIENRLEKYIIKNVR